MKKKLKLLNKLDSIDWQKQLLSLVLKGLYSKKQKQKKSISLLPI